MLKSKVNVKIKIKHHNLVKNSLLEPEDGGYGGSPS